MKTPEEGTMSTAEHSFEGDAGVLGGELQGEGRGEAQTAAQAHEPPGAALMRMVLGCLVSQAVCVAAKLGIADLLAEGPIGATELAEATGVHPRSLYRILRTLATFGVFKELPGSRFELTPMAEALRSDAPGSLRDAAIFMGEEWHWRVWGHTIESVRTGGSAWERAHGTEIFPWFAARPEESAVFNRAMTSFSNLATAAVVEAYDFSGFDKLVDVAGGHGLFLSEILRANPRLRGVLFDQPHVIEGAREPVASKGLSERCELVGGDFFESVPAGADGYIMKHIIHDWDDERAVMILKNIARAMREDGRLLIVEMVLPPANVPHLGKVLDIEMLTSPGGVERTEEEYRELLDRAGLRLARVVPTESPYSVVEAFRK
jgi:O-methyltransferase domain/Dimerisation domain